MAMLASPPSSPSRSPAAMPRRWARKIERYCCLGVTYFPLFFVYSLTTWAVWVEATIGFLPADSIWIGKGTSFLGITIYILLNWSYTTAVFTNPGTTTGGHNGYSALPSYTPNATNFTVKANGELRYCKKCEARKPDRAHHCSTCRKCVLKMDHHCPWLATCVGLRNYKAFLLFLSYTTLFCFLCFGVSATWVWREILNDGEYAESLMPVNYVLLAVISGIIGLVLAGFTGWHILLASRGQTTIECLEKTRYLSPLRKSMQRQHVARGDMDHGPDYGQQLSDLHADGSSRTGINLDWDERQGSPRHQTYDAYERQRARARYEEYLNEQDAEKLPSAFDLGWRKNFLHLFGPRKALWPFPINTTVGDGWSWVPSPKWVEARDRLAREREAQRVREHNAGWGEPLSPEPPTSRVSEGAGRHYVSYPVRTQSKADRVLGRRPDQYHDADGVELTGSNNVSSQTLHTRRSRDQFYEDTSSDEDAVEQHALDRRLPVGWPQKIQKVGLVTNALLGNTAARPKDDIRGWNDVDEGVD